MITRSRCIFSMFLKDKKVDRKSILSFTRYILKNDVCRKLEFVLSLIHIKGFYIEFGTTNIEYFWGYKLLYVDNFVKYIQ